MKRVLEVERQHSISISAVWVGRICMGDDLLAGPCMKLSMVLFLLHVVLHGDVGGA